MILYENGRGQDRPHCVFGAGFEADQTKVNRQEVSTLYGLPTLKVTISFASV